MAGAKAVTMQAGWQEGKQSTIAANEESLFVVGTNSTPVLWTVFQQKSW